MFCFNTETLFCFYPVLCFRLFVRLSLPLLLQLFVIFCIYISLLYYLSNYLICYIIIYPIISITIYLYGTHFSFPFSCPPDWFLLFYCISLSTITITTLIHTLFSFCFLPDAQNFTQKKIAWKKSRLKSNI